MFSVQTLDGDFFDQLRGYFTTLGQVEVDACKNAITGFEAVVYHAKTVSGVQHMYCFYFYFYFIFFLREGLGLKSLTSLGCCG